MPRAKQMSDGRSSRKRFISRRRPHRTPTGKPASERLAVGHHVGAARRSIPARRRRRSGIRRTPRRRSARSSAPCTPRAAAAATRRTRARSKCAWRSLPIERGVAGAPRVGMQRLQRIHQHAGDVAARPQHAERGARPSPSACRCRAPTRGVPTPGCTSSHQPWYAPQKRTRCDRPVWYRASRTACITASVPDMWNDTSSSPEMSFSLADVVGDDGVIRAEHRTEVADALDAGVDALLVEVVPEHVGAVRAGEVVGRVAVEIAHEDPGRLLARSAPTFRCCVTYGAVLKRHAIGLMNCRSDRPGSSASLGRIV